MRSSCKHRIGIVHRTGLTVMELTISVAVLAVLLATAMRMISVTSSQIRSSERRLIALQTVQAISEQIGNIPWDNLPTEAANQIPLPESTTKHLPDAELKVAVEDETDPIAKRVTVELTWSGTGGDHNGPVRMTSWVFPENLPAPQ
jgi:hypothetical protein